MAMSQVPIILAWGVFATGLACLAYLFSEQLLWIGARIRKNRMEPTYLMMFFLAGAAVCTVGAGVTFFYQQYRVPTQTSPILQNQLSPPVAAAPIEMTAGAPKLQPPTPSIAITPNSNHLRTRAEIVAIRNDLLELMRIVDGDIAPLNQKLSEFVVSQPHRVFVDLASVESQAKELHASLETVMNKLNAFMERHRDDDALHNVINFSETGDPKVVLSRLEQFTYNIPSTSLDHIQIPTANIYWGAAYTLRSVVSSKWLVTLRDRVAALRHQLDSEYSTAQ
jgi:hypothetical protein